MGLVSTPQAQQVTPQQARVLTHHPTLVKTIGAGALALLMSRLSASRR